VHFHQVERGHGSFRRTFEFAHAIDAEHVTADLADGVLTISVPKRLPPPARRIEVR
jgi:HSP20 family protein